MLSMATFGERLRELREERELSRTDLGRLAVVDPAYIYRLEVGRQLRPSFAVTEKLARALGVSTDELTAEGREAGAGEEEGDAERGKVARDVAHSMGELSPDESTAFAKFVRNYIHLPPEERDEFWGYVVYFFRAKGVDISFKQPQLPPQTLGRVAEEIAPYGDESAPQVG
jgi:transcriptional regulator with XRE-family HTH domain